MKIKLFQRTFEEGLRLEKDKSLKFVDDWESSNVYKHGLTIGNMLRRMIGLTLVYVLCWGITYLGLESIDVKSFSIWKIIYIGLYFISVLVVFWDYKQHSEKYMRKYNKDTMATLVIVPLMIGSIVFSVVLLSKYVGLFVAVFHIIILGVSLSMLSVSRVRGLSFLMDGKSSLSKLDKIGQNLFIAMTTCLVIFGFIGTVFYGIRDINNTITGEKAEEDPIILVIILFMVMPIITWVSVLYAGLPRLVQGYYVHKYPEEYRKRAEKTVEDWYDDEYVKKHPEILKQAQEKVS